MRISLWPALVCGSMLAATVGNAVFAAPPAARSSGAVTLADAADDADDDTNSVDDSPGATVGFGGFNPYQPMQYIQDAGQYPPDGGGAAPPMGGYGYDPAYAAPNAWPETSPFSQHRLEETYNSGGLWQYDAKDDFAAKVYLGIDYLYGSGLKPGNHYIGSPQFQAVTFNPAFPSFFPTQTTSLFGNFFHNGIMGRLGFENPDGSGAQVSGFSLFESSLDNGLVSRHAIAGQISTLSPLAGIIFDNGDGTSTATPYDTRFFQKFNQGIFGADADYYLSPFFQRNSFKVKMLFGAKYLRIHEDFTVVADGSNFGFLADFANNTLTQLAFFPGDFPYTTVITSSATSTLVGPHIGVRYDLGGDKFKIWGQSKIAVAANMDNLQVTGLNTVNPWFASISSPAFNKAYVKSSPHTVQNISGTHISPIFDTQINIEFPGFTWIPWVNRWDLFKHANMRVGFNYVYVGEVARPANIIDYKSFDPQVMPGARTWFSYSTVNFAVNWKY
jgi:hypothetical protein